jgi:hypothetical protein
VLRENTHNVAITTKNNRNLADIQRLRTEAILDYFWIADNRSELIQNPSCMPPAKPLARLTS